MPTSSSSTVSTPPFREYIDRIEAGGLNELNAIYALLNAQGYNYAGWAGGVARGDSITGLAAIDFLNQTALLGLGSNSCKILSGSQIDNIRTDMGIAYLQTLINHSESQTPAHNGKDISYKKAEKFHAEVFTKNGLSIKNWTLKIPMELLIEREGLAAGERVWERLRDSEGTGPDALWESTKLLAEVSRALASTDPDRVRTAREWISTVTDTATWDKAQKFIVAQALLIDTSTWMQARQFMLARTLITGVLFTGISDQLNQLVASAMNWTRPNRDPLVLDLDGGGILTRGIGSGASESIVLFDHDGDGVKTATGWVARGEGILVRDLNGNGRIDHGRELFGDNTQLTRGDRLGLRARDGFEALADLDLDDDGRFNAADAAQLGVKIWRDLNQDGLSQQNELFSFEQIGIEHIEVGGVVNDVQLAGGNRQTHQSRFVRSGRPGYDPTCAGTSGHVGNLLFTENTFYREFTDDNTSSNGLQFLPNMQGSGMVRDLHAAMGMDHAAGQDLRAHLTRFVAMTRRDQQRAALDTLIQRWGASSAMPNSLQAAQTQAALSPGNAIAQGRANALETFALANPALYAKIAALEQFNGSQILSHWLGTPRGRVGFIWTYSPAQVALLGQAYGELRESVYKNLALQTRLMPYLVALELTIDAHGVRLNSSALKDLIATRRASDPGNTLADMVDLLRYAGDRLKQAGADLPTHIVSCILDLPAGSDHSALFSQLGIRSGARIYGNDHAEIIVGNTGSDNLSGNARDNLLIGGTGNDTLTGGSGNNTYYFGKGDGLDTIEKEWRSDHAYTSTIQFKADVLASEVKAQRYKNDLLLTIPKAGGAFDRITVKDFFYQDDPLHSYNPVQRVRFNDGTVWDIDHIKALVTRGQGIRGQGYHAASAQVLVQAMAMYNPRSSSQCGQPQESRITHLTGEWAASSNSVHPAAN